MAISDTEKQYIIVLFDKLTDQLRELQEADVFFFTSYHVNILI